jgi:hypothetical protein
MVSRESLANCNLSSRICVLIALPQTPCRYLEWRLLGDRFVFGERKSRKPDFHCQGLHRNSSGISAFRLCAGSRPARVGPAGQDIFEARFELP